MGQILLHSSLMEQILLKAWIADFLMWEKIHFYRFNSPVGGGGQQS